MAPKPPSPPAPAPRRRSRLAVLALGFVLGAAVGTVMCAVMFAVGYIGTDSIDWVYRIGTAALMGMVVATVFGPLRPTGDAPAPVADRRGLRRRRF